MLTHIRANRGAFQREINVPVAVGRGSQTKAHLWAYNLQDPHIYFIFATHFARVALGAHGISAFQPLRCTRQAFGDTLRMPK